MRMLVVECEQSAVKQETAPIEVKTETDKEEESAASSVPRGASAARNENVERQQSDNREAAALVSVRQEKNDNEELNNPLAAGDDNESSVRVSGADLVQPTDDVTGDDDYGSPVMPSTSRVTRSKKRSRETVVSSVERRGPRNVRAQTRSNKRAKRPHSTLHETSEETVTAPLVRRSLRSATAKAREGRSEVLVEETDGDCMPIHEDDESPLDDGEADRDEDGRQGIVAKSAQQGRPAIKSWDERFTDLIGFKQKFGHCNVPQRKYGEYQSLGNWCKNLTVCWYSSSRCIFLSQYSIRGVVVQYVKTFTQGMNGLVLVRVQQ